MHAWDPSEYAAEVDAQPELERVAQALLAAARVGPGTRVLDVACGPGHVAAAATKLGAAATGLDTSEEMIAYARNRFPGTFIVGNMRKPPGQWDAIVSRLGAHHAEVDWLAAAYVALRPGGALAIAETAAVDDEARANGFRNPEEWATLLEKVGFQRTQVQDSGVALQGHGPKGPIFIIAASK